MNSLNTPKTSLDISRSMGAVTAILRAAEDPGISALVLDSPFSARAATYLLQYKAMQKAPKL